VVIAAAGVRFRNVRHLPGPPVKNDAQRALFDRDRGRVLPPGQAGRAARRQMEPVKRTTQVSKQGFEQLASDKITERSISIMHSGD
jgi:hypothetical protein